MPRPAVRPAPSSLLLEPVYGYQDADGGPHRPTLREVAREWCDAVNVARYPYRGVGLLFFLFHVCTAICLVWSFAYFSWMGLLFGFLVHQWISLVYQTLWYHRYTSHGAFRFSSPWWARLLLWTNPVVLREETFAIAHRIHHQRSDGVGDPYGPHIGWLGSYLSWESLQKTDPAIGDAEYAALQRSLRHLPFPANDVDAFRRTGSVERLLHYAARTLVAQVLFAGFAYAVGGLRYVLVAYGALFVFTFLLRDFPWRGHGGNFRATKIPGWEFDGRSRSLNTRFYGYLAGEWHDNHHRLPTSATSAFLPGQIDVAFEFVRLLRAIGVVSWYSDQRALFRDRVLGEHGGASQPDDDASEAARAGAVVFLEK
jgi:fatty-acid desaturase